jgi:oligopeptide transport system ATP-binding protein
VTAYPISSDAGTVGPASRLLEVRNLKVTFATRRGAVAAVRGISFEVAAGEAFAIVGESGSGKSVTALALLRLLRTPPARLNGEIRFDGQDILALSNRELRELRGKQVTIVFQDVMASLNPVRTIGSQLTETLRTHLGLDRPTATRRAVEQLEAVAIPDATRQLGVFPHQLSGGMRQRVMIAIALACRPRLLIFDEGTTALDVSVQAQILELLRTVTAESGVSTIVISHDLSVVAGIADRVAVMYAGELVEVGKAEQVFANPHHPYTLGLLRCLPRLDEPVSEHLPSIRGTPPNALDDPRGCSFTERCPFAFERCSRDRPQLSRRDEGHSAACWLDPGTALQWPDETP